MPLYVIEAPHSGAQHRRALRETLGVAPASQDAFLWGCSGGEHAAWAVVDAASPGEALELLPAFLWKAASVHRVETFSANDMPPVWDEAV
jgi:hypothetical protein